MKSKFTKIRKLKLKKYGDGGETTNLQSDTLRDPATLNKYMKDGVLPDYVVKDTQHNYSYKPNEESWLDKVDNVLSAPQKAVTYALTGKYQKPSEALNIDNKWGALATDVILDPVNLLGLGWTKGAKVATTVAKGSSTAEKAIQAGKTTVEAIDYSKHIGDFNKYKDVYATIGKSLKDADFIKNLDFAKYAKYDDLLIAKDIINTTTNSTELVAKLNKLGAGAAIINDLINQNGEMVDNSTSSYTPHYPFSMTASVNNNTNFNKTSSRIQPKGIANLEKKEPSQLSNTASLNPKLNKASTPKDPSPKPEVKRQYKQEGNKYYMRFFNRQTDKEEWRPITKESYRLGNKEEDEDTEVRYKYKSKFSKGGKYSSRYLK